MQSTTKDTPTEFPELAPPLLSLSEAEQARMSELEALMDASAYGSRIPVNYFDEYDTRHEAMRLLSEAWWHRECPPELRPKITRIINYVRETAMKLIPYGATTPNKTWDGKRA